MQCFTVTFWDIWGQTVSGSDLNCGVMAIVCPIMTTQPLTVPSKHISFCPWYHCLPFLLLARFGPLDSPPPSQRWSSSWMDPILTLWKRFSIECRWCLTHLKKKTSRCHSKYGRNNDSSVLLCKPARWLLWKRLWWNSNWVIFYLFMGAVCNASITVSLSIWVKKIVIKYSVTT